MPLLCKLLVVVLLSFPALAQAPPVYKHDNQNHQGNWYSRIINNTNSPLYCWLGYSEFYVDPHSHSRWYGYADQWGCDPL